MESVMLKSGRLLVVHLLVFFLTSGCATLPSDFKEPGVSLVSVTPRILNGVAPEFDIVLRVTNPNRSALDIVGLSYTIHLVGNKVIEGAANDLPKVAAYGEAEVKLSATADLFGGLQVLSGFLANPTKPVDFEFNAQIDVGTFYPMININKTGVISLQ
jgi:LEA14-like dessication related protein